MTASRGKSEPATKATGAPDRPDTGRRRFIVAGLAAAPIIVTLSARPALAQGVECTAYGTSRGVKPEGCYTVLEPTFSESTEGSGTGGL